MFLITTKYRVTPGSLARKVTQVVHSEAEVFEGVAARLENTNVEWFKVTPL